MKAVVLAAGEGTRMWPLATNKPKHLLPVAGRPLITHILDAIKQNQIEEVFVVVGFKRELIKSAVGDGSQRGLRVKYLDQRAWTGTASALKIAFEAVGRESFLAIYGDLWLTSSAIRAVTEKSRSFARVVGVVKVKNPFEYGLVNVSGDKVLGIVEKPARMRRTEGLVNAGIYVLDSEVFRAIERTGVSRRAEYEFTTSLQHMLNDGNEIGCAVIPGENWIDIGRPWDLLEANQRALSNMTNGIHGTVEPGAVLKGEVWLDENSVVKSGCNVEGPVYIGRDSTIGPNTRIRPSTCIENRVVVGTSCEVKNSIIMTGTKVPHLSYVGDSIIGENCNLGAGTITANIRFDQETVKVRVKGRLADTGRRKIGAMIGDGVQTGINVSILPGVRIGSGSWIGPGTILSRDLKSGQFIRAKQTQVLRRLRKPRAAE
jgi:UDP-N-acetylglucosamine diphosphorylase/glucosamine-1-phosphate N-acetyltransferase